MNSRGVLTPHDFEGVSLGKLEERAIKTLAIH